MRYLLLLLLSTASFISYSQVVVDIRSYGARGDSSTVNTVFIQEAIDSVNRAGGGEVLITNGVYLSSTIRLKSNVTLRIAPGTTLRGVTGDNNYPNIQYSTPSWMDVDYTKHSLIFAESASNIRITGGGTIDGNGFDATWLTITNKNLRPFGLRFHLIQNLDIDSINLIQAPQWMVHVFQCQNVHIYQVRLYNQCWGANDGIDIDCSRNVLMEDCNFDTNDDSAPVKTHCTDTCRDVTIRNCTFATYERAVKVGNECFGPIINVHFENITVTQSSFSIPGLFPLNVMYIAVADGGSIDSVFFDNIHINTPSQTSIFIKLCMRDFQYETIPKPFPKYLRNVWISNVVTPSSTTIPCSVSGIEGYPVQNIHFINVTVSVPGGGPAGYQNISDQPTTRPECNIWGDSLPAYGLYVRHVYGIELDSFCVDTLVYDQRPEYYFGDTMNVQMVGNGCPALPTGIEQVDGASAEVKVYPNPASDMINLSNIPKQVEGIIIYSTTGAKVLAIPVLGRSSFSLDVSQLSTGVYFVAFIGEGHYLMNRKMLITR